MLRHALFITLLSFALPAYAADPSMDFRTAKGKDAASWLQNQGFTLERDAADESKAALSLTEKGLTMKALGPSQALLARKDWPDIPAGTVELEWGVDQFPPGASYAKQQRNEAVMLFVFFGDKTVESGGVGVPDLPYFLALHLCENDAIDKPEKGEFYHKGGRFICVAHPQAGETIKTTFDLNKGFKDVFGFDAPPLSGIALEYDTTKAQNDGTAAGFVSSIKFIAPDKKKSGKETH